VRSMCIAGVGIVVAAQLCAGQSGLQLDREVRVIAADGDWVEPHLAVSPTDPNHLVGTAMIVRSPDFSNIDCSALASFDGGLTWTVHEFGLVTCGDPWVLLTDSGTALLSVLSDEGISVYRSPDGGRSWPGPPTIVAGAHDHEMMVGGRNGLPVYLVSGLSRRAANGALRAAISVSVSHDDGRTFARYSDATLSNLSYEAMTPVVTSTGRLLVPFQDHHRSDNQRVESRRSWLLEFSGPGQHEVPRLIDEGCNRVGPVGWPTMALVPRPDSADRLVWVCEKEEARGLSVRYSDNAGETWSAGLVLGLDGSAPPTKVPSLAVTADGLLMASWSAPTSMDSNCTMLWAAASEDGGSAFLPAQQLSETPSCNTEGDVWARFQAGGDYRGLVATGPREFHVLWADAREGRFQLFTRRFRLRP